MSTTTNPWATVDALRAELNAAGPTEAIWEAFDPESHSGVLLELSPVERLRLLTPPEKYIYARVAFLRGVEALAFEWATGGRSKDALTLFDELLSLERLSMTTYCNALWVVQDDNTHLGVDEARAWRYLARCLPHGPDNAAIFFNASAVLTELGDVQGALDQLRAAVAFGVDREKMREQLAEASLFAPLREGGRCFQILEDPGLQGVTLVEQVIDKVRREGWGALRLGLRRFQPLSAEVLASIRLPNGATLPASLRAWLAFDGAWLASLGWFTLEPTFAWTPRSLGEIASAEYGGDHLSEAEMTGDGDPNWAREFNVPSMAHGFLLPGGSDSRRVYMLSPRADAHGDYPVLFTDVDEMPAVGIMYPGFDVWLGEKARVLGVATPDEGSTYTNAFKDPRFASRCRLHADVLFDGRSEVEFPARSPLRASGST
jgi:hypothetical protein